MGEIEGSLEAERNGRLLIRLMKYLGAKDVGSISGFFGTHESWRCPCCLRSKEEFARLDKNGNLLCAVHWHHDHFSDCIGDSVMRLTEDAYWARRPIIGSFERFPEIMICNDCNVAEGVAKKIVQAKPAFSFAPHEIQSFIRVCGSGAHEIDELRAKEIYEAVLGLMRIIGDKLRDAREVANADDVEPFIQAGRPVLKLVGNLRKEKFSGG